MNNCNLNIVKWPHPSLTKVADEVVVFDDNLRKIVAAMYETMKSENGIGLSGNQVNILRRILVTHVPGHPQITLINPALVTTSQTATTNEGCLSFPGVVIAVKRPNLISIKAKDEFGNDVVLEASGLLAVCIQHEMDHLDGIVFVDRL